MPLLLLKEWLILIKALYNTVRANNLDRKNHMFKVPEPPRLRTIAVAVLVYDRLITMCRTVTNTRLLIPINCRTTTRKPVIAPNPRSPRCYTTHCALHYHHSACSGGPVRHWYVKKAHPPLSQNFDLFPTVLFKFRWRAPKSGPLRASDHSKSWSMLVVRQYLTTAPEF